MDVFFLFNDGELLRFMMTHSLVKNSGGKGDGPFFHIPRRSSFACGINMIFNVDFEFLQGMDFNEISDIHQLQKVVFLCKKLVPASWCERKGARGRAGGI